MTLVFLAGMGGAVWCMSRVEAEGKALGILSSVPAASSPLVLSSAGTQGKEKRKNEK